MGSEVRRFCCVLGVAVACVACVAITSAETVDYGPDYVIVGKVGNAGNTRHIVTNGYGAVDYEYGMNKYEVTAAQYAAFLNSVATTADPYGLWSANMTSSYGCMIRQSGAAGAYTYSVDSGYENRPVNFVSWYDAARYTNWLTTGDTESGAYQFDNGSFVGVNRLQAVFQSEEGFIYVIPSLDEWYKAAYHNNVGMSGTDYFNYPTGTDVEPGNDLPDTGNNANLLNNRTTPVGEFVNSPSPYGTFDQLGNVAEWTEAFNPIEGSYGYIGTAFSDDAAAGHARVGACFTSGGDEWHFIGFRVAGYAVPEPASAVMLVFAAIAGLLWRRR